MIRPEPKTAQRTEVAGVLLALVIVGSIAGCDSGTIPAFMGQTTNGQVLTSIITDFVREATAAFLF